MAARRIGVVLRSCKWIDAASESGQLVEATVVPPANTVSSSTAASLRVMVSLLAAVMVAGCLAFAAQVLLQLSATAAPRGDVPKPSHDPCCCTQPGRVISDCGGVCSCAENCKLVCSEPLSAWDSQCYQPYTNLSDDFRNVKILTGWPPPWVGRAHADGPQGSSESFNKLCPTSPEVPFSINDDHYYMTTGVGGERWYRFVGSAGDGLPLYPPPQYRCGTALGGWLSGYNRTAVQSGTTGHRNATVPYTQHVGQIPSGTSNITKIASGPATACERACDADKACFGYTRTRRASPNASEPCWLHSTVPTGLSYAAPQSFMSWWQKPGTIRLPALSCAMDSALFSQCNASRCPRGSPRDGGVATPGGLCREHCSRLNGALGWCGKGNMYVNGKINAGVTNGLDCTPCQNWMLWSLQGLWRVETSNVPPRTYLLDIDHTTGTYQYPGGQSAGQITDIQILEPTFRLDWHNSALGGSGALIGTISPDGHSAVARYDMGRTTYEWRLTKTSGGRDDQGRISPFRPGRVGEENPSELTDGPPIDFSEPGRYPTAAEGKVDKTVCFSAGQVCQDRQNDVCGGATCSRYQTVTAVRCDGFFLWQLSYVPFCRSGFCTINTTLQQTQAGPPPPPAVTPAEVAGMCSQGWHPCRDEASGKWTCEKGAAGKGSC